MRSGKTVTYYGLVEFERFPHLVLDEHFCVSSRTDDGAVFHKDDLDDGDDIIGRAVEEK